MVLSNSRKKRGNLTLDELFKRPPPPQRPSTNEDEELQLAMEMSQREHINEQKRLFEQYSLLSQKQFNPSTPSSTTTTTTTAITGRKKRRIKAEPEEQEHIENFTDDEDDDDQWFQTVSMRPQPPPVKKAQPKPKPKPKPKLKQKDMSKQKSKRHIPAPPPTSTSSATAFTSSSSSSCMHNNDTTSSSSTTTIVKQEEGNGILLDIDDVDEWLEAKTEITEASDPALEITDLDAYLDNYQDDDDNDVDMDNEPTFVSLVDEQQDIPPPPSPPQASSQYMPCPMCQKLFKQGRDIQEHAAECNNMISDTDSDSDCDIIDLINPANTMISKQTSPPPQASLAEAQQAPVEIVDVDDDDDDDGYLSPLEGFTSIKNNQNEASNPYFQQLQQPAPKPRKARATKKSTTTKRGSGGGRGWFRPYRRKKKS